MPAPAGSPLWLIVADDRELGATQSVKKTLLIIYAPGKVLTNNSSGGIIIS